MRLGLWLLLAGAGWGFSFWVYARRELPVRGRRALATLRGGSLALVLLLLLDPSLPGADGSRREWVLLDTSPSMSVPQGPEGAGAPPAVEARADAAGGQGAQVATFGSPSGRLPDGWAAADGPEAALDSRLAPVLTLALESGASRVRVLTDLRIDDPVEVDAILRSAPVPVRFVDLGGDAVNAGVVSLDLPEAARAGETVNGTATLFGGLPGPVRVALTVNGVPAWDTTVTLEGTGRVRVPVHLTAPDSAGPTAITVRISGEQDAHAGDDARSHVLEVDPEAGELVLVSWLPDWEARFLLPVLEEVTGLRAQGYLKAGPDRFMTMKGPVAFPGPDEVAAALGNARVAVVHGLPADADPSWLAAVSRAPRLMVLPAAAAAEGDGGEWYASADVPPSPLAGDMAGIPLLGLPPLMGRREPAPGEGGMPVLLLQRGGRGSGEPAVILREAPGGTRRVEALAYGFWRWAFREGAPRELYRRLWSGSAGWLLAGDAGNLRESGLTPSRTVARPGEPVPWRAGAAAGGFVSVSFDPVTGEASGAGGGGEGIPVDSLGRATVTAPTQPGTYRWAARGSGEGAPEAAGLMVVEASDLDLLPPRAVQLQDLAEAGVAASPGGRRPVRTHPAPYLLLLGLLTAEWVVRRRTGLR